MKKFYCISLAVSLISQASLAAPCSNYTYTFTNGTTADANQVNANFSSILNCANTYLAPLVDPRFTGNVGIGNTSPSVPLSVRVTVDGNIIEARRHGATQNPGVIISASETAGTVGISATYSTSAPAIIFSQGATERMRIAANGNVAIGGVSSPTYLLQVNGTAAGNSAWTNLSDSRLKKDVEEISGALNAVLKLRGVRFYWKDSDERKIGKELELPTDEPQLGFIAQEVRSVVPEIVVEPKSTSNAPYSIKESDLIPVLVEAIKEQQKQIDQLRSVIAELRTSLPH